MNCDNMANRGPNSWMVSTWRALWCDIDPSREKSIIYKGNNYVLGIPLLPLRVDRLSPTFAHFIGLKPRRIYERLARAFRTMALAQVKPATLPDHPQ
jgi:hypothetical protein